MKPKTFIIEKQAQEGHVNYLYTKKALHGRDDDEYVQKNWGMKAT